MSRITSAFRPAFSLFCLAILLVLGSYAMAQPVKDNRKEMEAARLELMQVEAALQRDTLDDKRLADLRARLEPVDAMIDEIITREQPRADEIKARIEKLGPVPDAKSPPESADVAKDRAEQQQHWQEVDETLRLARALALRVDQLGQTIGERRRQNFTNQILAQNASLISPLLWLDVARAMPKDVRAFTFLMQQWVETTLINLDWYEAALILALIASFVAGLPRARLWVRTGGFTPVPAHDGEKHEDEREREPSRPTRLMRAARQIIINAIAPAAGLMLLHTLMESFGLLPGRAAPVLEAFVNGLAFLAFMSGLAGSVLSPHHRAWRLFPMPDAMAQEFWRLIQLVTLTIAFGRLIEAINAAIVASLPLTMVVKGLIAVIIALMIAGGLRRAFRQEEGKAEVSAGVQAVPPALLPVRLVGWGIVLAVLGAAAFGYIALARFLVTQVVWITVLAFVAGLALAVIDELLGTGLSAQGMMGRRVREMTGLAASSMDQFSVLGSGIARLILFITIGLLALAPWGIDSAGFLGTVRAAFFGFQVGGVTISLSTIALALGLFILGFAMTRTVQNWLDTRYLPHTGLDIGLRNSIRTIFGYIGIVIAAMVALSQLGLSLDKITIVAGALSVGIGFGLQSIVNNFVSGLILLWERPIRVGDWIVVGDEQGKVKHINVRATEIETFDRASLIIPNSEFISGRVKNWMHADRTGRIIIPINVDYAADPQAVQALLREAALAHRQVMSDPKPVVIFKNLGESGMDFELRCFVDVDDMLPTRSELLFDIFRRLQEAGIGIPYPTRRLEITTMNADATPPMSLATIAQAAS